MVGENTRFAPQFWTNPGAEEVAPSLVRLTGTDLTLAIVPKTDLENALSAVSRGETLPGQVIPLPAFVAAEADEDSAEVTVTYKASPNKTATATIPFATVDLRDEFYQALVSSLGPTWERRPEVGSRWTLGFWIWVLIALTGLITWGIHAEAKLVAEGKQPINWGKGKLKLLAGIAHWAEAKLGPQGVLIVGGIVIGLGLLVFLVLLVSPPKNVVVKPVQTEQLEASGIG